MGKIDWFPIPNHCVMIIQALQYVTPMTFTGDDVSKNKVYVSAKKRNKWNSQVCTLSNSMNRHGMHPSENRYFSIEEIARLDSYPDEFEFIGTATHRTCQIGNSVPPLFMHAIASKLRLLFFDKVRHWIPNQESYKQLLDSAWQAHLKPRLPNAPTFISTFSGCGGSSLGYSIAGYKELLAVEWNDNAVVTFKANFPGIPVYHGDIVKLSVQECLDLAQIQPRELSLLDGSPPCQGFSIAGKRQLNDQRNGLFKEYVRLLCGLMPQVFVMENVSGLVKGKMKLIFAEIMRELKASGYQVKCKLLNAKYFNVPQSRQRLIFIGVRNDMSLP